MIHFFCPVTGNGGSDRVSYFDDSELPEGKDPLELVKAHMRLIGADRFVFDGLYYEYAHGAGRWYRGRWTGELDDL